MGTRSRDRTLHTTASTRKGNSKRSRGNTKTSEQQYGHPTLAASIPTTITQQFYNHVRDYIKEEVTALENLENLVQKGRRNTDSRRKLQKLNNWRSLPLDRYKKQQLRIKTSATSTSAWPKTVEKEFFVQERAEFSECYEPNAASSLTPEFDMSSYRSMGASS